LKKRLLVILALFGLLAACSNPADDHPHYPVNPDQRTVVVFDNTQGICAAVVYSDSRRRDEDKIIEIPAGKSSQKIEWEPNTSEPFYYLYRVTLKDVSGFAIDYVSPNIGRDHASIRIDPDVTTIIPVPKLEATVSSPDALLSNKSYIFVRNNSSSSFRLEYGAVAIVPDNLDVTTVNPGELAYWTINPGPSSPYRLMVLPDYKQFPAPDSFKTGCVNVYNLGSGAAFTFVREIEIKLENIGKTGA